MDRSSSATRAYALMMKKFSRTALVCLFLLFVTQVNGYSKYGRTCKDIGCRSTEKCTMVDECDVDGRKCGYPTCVRDDSIRITCATKLCGGGQRCEDKNGAPVCVNNPSISGYDSAGVSVVNGHRTPTDSNNNNNNNHGYAPTNVNPYANANAPPSVDEPGRNPVSSSTNYGYPPYPSSSNSNNNNGRVASYPPASSGTNLGYPPYPTQNRMPMPGQIGVYQQPPPPQAGGFYPGSHASGYPGNQPYPSHSNYPYQTRNYNSNAHYPRYRGASAKSTCAQLCHVLLATLSLAIATRYLS
ncbi:myb-like protein A isoform X4 [Venturia canescens]|uniref:myb-like protein A isoform X4 n=1 Tax=Venturia canescens TaxID=32260 RepID=UPI001C9C87E7|nr:myb-like protein A isoform X4 [Venturia canescens]